MKRWLIIILGVGITVFLASTGITWQKNRMLRTARPAPTENQRFIAVEPGVELEVLDFGGKGRSIILLAGLGDTAHIFASFSKQLTLDYHVIAITRRGFGLSTAPRTGYNAERLGEDVVAVIDALHLDRPVLVGHSVAGGELSSVATFHPEKVSGLIYLDAGYAYALWDEVHGNRGMRAAAVARYFEPIIPAAVENRTFAIIAGQRRFTRLQVPALAIFADPHDLRSEFTDPVRREKEEQLDSNRIDRQIGAFQRQVPSAKIIRLPHASHMIFRSNEAEVVKAMNAFIKTVH